MARGHLRHFQKDSAGNAVQNAAVTVKDLAGNTLTLYADASSGTTVSNPLVTNAAGLAECWIATPQTVGLTITDNGGTATAGGQTLNPFNRTLTTELLTNPDDTYYVRVTEPPPHIHVSPTGDDSFDGRWDRPKATLAAALTLVNASGGVVESAPAATYTPAGTLSVTHADVELIGNGSTIDSSALSVPGLVIGTSASP